jgi:hypothetical protein
MAGKQGQAGGRTGTSIITVRSGTAIPGIRVAAGRGPGPTIPSHRSALLRPDYFFVIPQGNGSIAVAVPANAI